MNWKWWHVPLAVVGFVVLIGGGMVFVERAKRGRRLTTTSLRPDGAVAVPPETLRAQAELVLGRAVSMEAYSLARMLTSEGNSDNVVTRRARAWIAYNDLKHDVGKRLPSLFRNFTDLFTYSTVKTEKGLYGDQRGRRYATIRDPYEGDLIDAEALLQEFGTGSDPTGGATKWVDVPALGKQPGTEGKTLASIEKEWGLKGRELAGARDGFVVFGRIA